MTGIQFHPAGKKWWDTIEKGAGTISDRMLEMVDVRPGQHILDVATGIGEPALNAARRVGVQGHVTATDQASEMLAIAQRRAKSHGLDNITFLVSDGEVLGISKNDFDALLCRWGLMFMPDVDKALVKMYGRLKPGGRIAAAVWSSPENAPSISLAMNVVRELLQLPPPSPGTPNPFCLADTTSLTQRFQKAGFKDIRIESVMVEFTMPSAEHYTEFTKDIHAPLRALLADRTAEQQDMAWDAITDAARAYATVDGSLHIDNEAICIAATR